MNKRLSAEEILKEHWPHYPDGSDIRESVFFVIREGMRQGRDAALEWAYNSAYENIPDDWDNRYPDPKWYKLISANILSGKTHPDLEIK